MITNNNQNIHSPQMRMRPLRRLEIGFASQQGVCGRWRIQMRTCRRRCKPICLETYMHTYDTYSESGQERRRVGADRALKGTQTRADGRVTWRERRDGWGGTCRRNAVIFIREVLTWRIQSGHIQTEKQVTFGHIRSHSVTFGKIHFRGDGNYPGNPSIRSRRESHSAVTTSGVYIIKGENVILSGGDL